MRLWPAALLTLAACTQVPDLEALDSPAARAADYPRLLPLEMLLDAPPPSATEAERAALEARARALRARADRLRRPVIDPQSQSRLDGAARDAG